MTKTLTGKAKGKEKRNIKKTLNEEVTFTPLDVASYLKTQGDIVGYLAEIMKEDDDALFMAALGDVARARGMTKVAKETGLAREGLYRTLKKEGQPLFSTINKVVRSMGYQLTICAK